MPRSKELADDELHVDEFGLDLDPLVKEIQVFNEEVLVTPFRPPEDQPVVAPDSGDVQGSAEPVDAGPAPGPAAGYDRTE